MKLSVTYLHTILKYGYPPKLEDDYQTIQNIQKLGFHYLEMDGIGPKHMEQIGLHRKELKKHLDDNGIHVHNFCCVDPDLVNMDENIRRLACDRFIRTAELGIFLGTETLHLASYAPPLICHDKALYQLNQKYSFDSRFGTSVPEGFNWHQVWEVLVESCQYAASIAKQFGCTVIMEPRVGEIICSADSMIRLIQDVGEENFKANFDTAHFSAQRENPVLALAKLEGMYANIHLADNNPVNAAHLPLGRGTIDWPVFLKVLAEQNYDGYLGLDLDCPDSLDKDLLESVAFIENLASKLEISIQK